METTGIETGAIAAGGAVLMKALDYASRFIPWMNRNGKDIGAIKEEIRKDMESIIGNHQDLCVETINGKLNLHEQRLDTGDIRFKEMTEKMDSNHNQIINILLDIKRGRG